MGLIFFTFLFFIIFVVVYYYRTIPYSIFNSSKCNFKENISDSDAEFLRQCFDIEITECRAFRFDGESFFLRRKIHYKAVDSIMCVSNRKVTTTNSSLPVDCRWKHENMNGGPDMRYKDNPGIMTTMQYKIGFKGAKRGLMCLYDYPYRNDINKEIQKVIDKFNFMLSHKEFDFENYKKRYLKAFQDHKKLETIKANFMQRRNAATEVIKAFSILASDLELKSNRVDLAGKYQTAKEELTEINSSIAQIDNEIKELLTKMNFIAKQLKEERMKSESIKTILNYKA